MALLLSQGFQTKPYVCVRYKRKGLNQVGYSLVQDQKQQQQQNTQQQHDLHWNEHHEQSKLLVSNLSLDNVNNMSIILPVLQPFTDIYLKL